MKFTMQLPLLCAALVSLFVMSFQTMNTAKSLENVRPWELLGLKKVNYALDRDEIVVTAREGVFTAIQVKVKRSPINMQKLVVHYGNGETEDIELRNNFAAGSESRVIDLLGNKRIIRKIVFWYDTKNLARGKGIVEVWGRH